MRFFKENNSLCFKHQYETVMITPWGKNALRVRAGIIGSSGNYKRKYYVNRVGKYADSHILCRR